MTARAKIRSFVFAVEFRVAESRRVGSILASYEQNLRGLGAHYAFVYESVVEPDKVLVVIGMRTEQPLLDLLRSPHLFEWFDAVGVDDIPAIFAGETLERFDIGEAPLPGKEVVVAAIAPVQSVDDFMVRVRDSLEDFEKAGISRTLVYRAFDTPSEVLFLQQLASVRTAMHWIERSDIAANWLTAAGVGGYPPVFVGRFVHAMRLPDMSRTDRD
jgi:hypothetical protein